MFTLDIVDSDAFLDMPLSTQALYFHLSMRADDDGFIDNAKRIMRTIGVNDDDMKILLGKNFVIPFEDGICVIKHWRLHNYIRSDRYKETNYTDKKDLLGVKDNGAYTLKRGLGIPNDIPLGDTGKVRLGKGSIGKSNILSGKPNDMRSIIYKDTVDYLNTKAGTQYKHSSKKTRSLIDARIKAGFQFKDFKTVIDNKTKEWLNTDMAKYLRPETLFGTKFESYLNQKVKKQDSGIEWFDDYVKGKENA